MPVLIYSSSLKLVMMAFILAMLRHPDVLQKAQDEMDRVVGNNRLPDFEDKDSLPYLNALITELYRLVRLMVTLLHWRTDFESLCAMRCVVGILLFL